MKISFAEALEAYKDLKLGALSKAKGNKSEQYFSAVSCILRENGIEIQQEPTEKVSLITFC